MKLLPDKTLKQKAKVNAREPLGQGVDAAVIVVIFFAAGFGLDRLFGTTPLMMIVMTIIGAVGVFIRYWYLYDAKMAEHEATRQQQSTSKRKAA